MNDVEIKALINSAVDRELGGRRAAPPWQPARVPERQSGTHPVARWGVPVLAASVAALLVAGTVMAIGSGRDRRATPAGQSASPSVSRSVDPDQAAVARAYTRAVATAVEATEAAGVSVMPLSAQDAITLKDTTRRGYDITDMVSPMPGQTYSFTMSYTVGPSDNPPAVLTTEVRDVASGACTRPFLARPGHAYLIHCSMSPLAGVPGTATLTVLTPTASSPEGIEFPFSAASYTAAVAGAPEASAVAGVSDRAATATERQRPADSVGLLDGAVTVRDLAKSYPVTFIYIPSSSAAAVSVLAFSFTGVAAGSCPHAFRIRPAHAYLITCQVTFRAGAVGTATYEVTSPQGVDRVGIDLRTS